MWILCQRLKNFSKSQYAMDLLHKTLKLASKINKSHIDNADVIRKLKKFKTIESLFTDQKNYFHYHFNTYNLTKENPFYKIDALVWEYVFRKKVPRYNDLVYKMSYYIIYHVNQFKEYQFEDFKNLRANFSLYCIPPNYKEIVLKHNQHLLLSEKELNNETYSNYLLKKHTYSYYSVQERDTNQLKRTFIRFSHNNEIEKSNYSSRGKRKEDELYDELKDEEKKKKQEAEIANVDNPEDKLLASIVNAAFPMWANRHILKAIDTCAEVIY